MVLFWASMLNDGNNELPEDLIHYWLDESTEGSYESRSDISTDDAGTTPHKEKLDSPKSICCSHSDRNKICNDSSHGTSVQVAHSKELSQTNSTNNTNRVQIRGTPSEVTIKMEEVTDNGASIAVMAVQSGEISTSEISWLGRRKHSARQPPP